MKRSLTSSNSLLTGFALQLNLPSKLKSAEKLDESEFKIISHNIDVITEALLDVEAHIADVTPRHFELTAHIEQINSHLSQAWAIVDVAAKDIPKIGSKIMTNEQKKLISTWLPNRKRYLSYRTHQLFTKFVSCLPIDFVSPRTLFIV